MIFDPSTISLHPSAFQPASKNGSKNYIPKYITLLAFSGSFTKNLEDTVQEILLKVL